jgi:hypothetical protein
MIRRSSHRGLPYLLGSHSTTILSWAARHFQRVESACDLLNALRRVDLAALKVRSSVYGGAIGELAG